MSALDSMLKQAAESAWDRVVQRCAWCGRIADSTGRYVTPPPVFDAATVFTDGMCPQCGTRALAAISRRSARRDQLAAAA